MMGRGATTGGGAEGAMPPSQNHGGGASNAFPPHKFVFCGGVQLGGGANDPFSTTDGNQEIPRKGNIYVKHGGQGGKNKKQVGQNSNFYCMSYGDNYCDLRAINYLPVLHREANEHSMFCPVPRFR